MLGFLLEAEGGDFVGVVAVLGADLVLGDAHLSVEFDAGGVEFVAQGVEGDLVGDEGFLLGADLFNHGGDGFDGGAGVVGLVVGDELEGVESVDVVLELFGADAAAGSGGHGFSSGFDGRQKEGRDARLMLYQY